MSLPACPHCGAVPDLVGGEYKTRCHPNCDCLGFTTGLPARTHWAQKVYSLLAQAAIASGYTRIIDGKLQGQTK